jgi:hypothetical protein
MLVGLWNKTLFAAEPASVSAENGPAHAAPDILRLDSLSGARWSWQGPIHTLCVLPMPKPVEPNRRKQDVAAAVGRLLAVLALAFGLAAPPATAAPAIDYADAAAWLCRPGRQDVCSTPLTSTVVSAVDGGLARKTYIPDLHAPIDCFYVYPTVSQAPTANADIMAGPGERRAAAEQFARFGEACLTYAPLYRQTTVAAMRGQAEGADAELAYRDVLAAWRSYLARDNHGRGVVLLGHSQGARHLMRLIAEEIDGKPAQRLLVSAVLVGGDVQTPAGADVGGDFSHVPLCRAADQAGCVIAYSTFLASHPPGPDSPFGKGGGPGRAVACVNPAALLGHAALNAELLATPRVAEILGTTLVENPGVVSAACTTAGDRTFLAVSVKPAGAAALVLARALTDLDEADPGWGLHPLDVSLTLGDLVEIDGRQSKTWATAR